MEIGSSLKSVGEQDKTMTKKERLKWRLKEQPTPESLNRLVAGGLLTKDEAREILFTTESQEDRDENSLKAEIKFLRELVEKLAKGRTEIIETIKYVEPQWKRHDWYNPYIVWCDSGFSISGTTGTGLIDFNGTTTTNATNSVSNFASINTF